MAKGGRIPGPAAAILDPSYVNRASGSDGTPVDDDSDGESASPGVTLYPLNDTSEFSTDAADAADPKPGSKLVKLLMTNQNKIRFDAKEGPQAGGNEHARQGPGESYHFHLYHGSEEGPRISAETFRPLTAEDEKLLKGKYKTAVESLSDADKTYLSKATREIFHTGRVPYKLVEQLMRAKLRIPPYALPRNE